MLLFTPGPTPSPESIRHAFITPTIHHRTSEFEQIFAQVRIGLETLINLPCVLVFASTGTGAMEASITQLCHSKLLSISCGKFGERWGHIARANHLPHTEITCPWDTPPSAQDVLEALGNDASIDALALQVCESSGGLRLPLEDIAQQVKTHFPHVMIIADAITALGVEAIDTTHIDALIGGSQKAFMLPPGMSIIGLSQRALAYIDTHNNNMRGLYFSFHEEIKQQHKNTTAWTAPTTLIIGLARYFALVQSCATMPIEQALNHVDSLSIEPTRLLQGFTHVFSHTKRIALATQKAICALGLKLYPFTPSLAISAIAHDKATPIRQEMKKLGVHVAAGQGHITDEIFRINHMGIIPIYQASFVINALELALSTLGIRAFNGMGNVAFLQSYYHD